MLAQKMRGLVNAGKLSQVTRILDQSAIDDQDLFDEFDDRDVLPGEISQVTRILSLRKSPLLANIASSDLRSLAASSLLRKLDAKTDLIRVGTISTAMYTVINGDLSVLIAGDTIEVAVIKAGGMVGEMSLLTGEPAGATCRAKEQGCSVLEITKDTLMRLVRDRPTLRQHLDVFMAQRMAANAAMLEKMHETKARAQEEQMQKDDGNNLFEMHPWVSAIKNPHLKADPSVLQASVFELQMAYGFLLSPDRVPHNLILNRFSAIKPTQGQQNKLAHLHLSPAADEMIAPEIALERAGQELHQRILSCKPLTIKEYLEPSQSVDLCLEFLAKVCFMTAHSCSPVSARLYVCVNCTTTSTHCNALQRTATHCSTLQHTATRCNTLQHDTTHNVQTLSLSAS